MDANGQHFWLAHGGEPWTADVSGTLARHATRLCLASKTVARDYHEETAGAEAALGQVPMATDTFGTFAFYDVGAKAIRAGGAVQLEDEQGRKRPEEISKMPAIISGIENVTDLALGFDGLLYIAVGGKVRVHDIRGRLEQVEAGLANFEAWRLAADPQGGVWALDRTRKKLARLVGMPWPPPLDFASPPPEAFLPVEENPNPPRLVIESVSWIDPAEDSVALACSPKGRLAILLWNADRAFVRLPGKGNQRGATVELKGIEKPFSLAWISNERFAVLVAGTREAIVYEFTGAADEQLDPGGEIYPLRDHDDGPFMHGVSLPVHYACRAPAESEGDWLLWTRPLVSVSLPAFGTSARGTLQRPFDTITQGTAWHRLYVEADIPPGTGFTLYAAVSDTGIAPDGEENWHPHHFGLAANAGKNQPRAAWTPQVSEIPGHGGFLPDPPVRNRSGLFTVLLQRHNRPVRTLRGRYLHLKIEMRGNIRATPLLYAVRAYAPRFSYQDKYLPALYRETLLGPEADAVQPGEPSTSPDFLGRFLANFEGVLTRLEDSVAESWILTDPRSAPREALEWLSSWIGIAFEPWYPPERRREHVRRAAELFSRRGTMDGVKLALNIATGGGVDRGRIVVVEDHWFRRTLQTVLGLQLDREDPLLGGPIISGNSKVGETLFLSEEGAVKKFLALFDASIQLREADRKVVEEFFASLAHRITLVVHEQATVNELKVIERVAALEVPAHVAARVKLADRDFITGLSSLLGVDTYLRSEPPPAPVEVQRSTIGAGPQLLRPPSLDPRLEGTSS